MKKTSRRVFVKNVSGVAIAATMYPMTGLAANTKTIPMRTLGRTGEKVSIIGIGGYHIGAKHVSDNDAIKIIRKSIDNGVNFMDNAFGYNKGRSETLMGEALKDGYRNKVLLMTKIKARTVDGVKQQLETSLKRLQLDSFDLMQFHAVGNEVADVDAIYNNGLIKWAEEMRSQGVFKYIGFTGHARPKALLEMINRGFIWDTVQLPLNIGDAHREISFEKDVLPLAIEKNIGIIGMKSNGFGNLAKAGIATPVEGLRYAMSLPVSTVVSGIDTLDILNQNLTMAKNFESLSNSDREELLDRSKGKSDSIEDYLR